MTEEIPENILKLRALARERNRRYRLKHPDAGHLEYMRHRDARNSKSLEWRNNHKDQYKAYQSDYTKKRTEIKREYDKKYRAAMSEEMKQKRREANLKCYHKNPQKYRDWEKKNIEKVRAYKRKWAESNPTPSRLIETLSDEQKKKRRESALRYYYKNPKKYRDWEEKNVEKVREYKRKWAKANPGYHQYRNSIKSKAIKTDKSALEFYKFVRSKKSIPCYYCGEKISGRKAHIDHVIALAKEGNHASENLCASCPTCNLKKNAKLPSQTNFNNQPLLNL